MKVTVVLPVRDIAPTPMQKLGGIGEKAWRAAIRDKVREVVPDSPLEPAPGTRYSVEITFRMTADELKRAVDLDNLCKPVLDTVFTSANVSLDKPTGVLLQVNDMWVFRLCLEKVEVGSSGERGADITVTWDEDANAV